MNEEMNMIRVMRKKLKITYDNHNHSNVVLTILVTHATSKLTNYSTNSKVIQNHKDSQKSETKFILQKYLNKINTI